MKPSLPQPVFLHHEFAHLQGNDFFAVSRSKQSLDALSQLQQGVDTMLDEVSWWTKDSLRRESR